jgi:hypothetical protein
MIRHSCESHVLRSRPAAELEHLLRIIPSSFGEDSTWAGDRAAGKPRQNHICGGAVEYQDRPRNSTLDGESACRLEGR